MNARTVAYAATRPTWRMTATELARVVATHRGYTICGNMIRDERGRLVAVGWDSLATRMQARGWIETGVGVQWTRLHNARPLPTMRRTAVGYWV